MGNIEIYLLTHKKFDYEKNNLYKPLLSGSALLDEDYGYIRDDSGDNISKLNPYYAELTGQYWAWKNSKANIIGFCHYRRYFITGISMKKLGKEEIEEILSEYDIIMPKKRYLDKTNLEEIDISNKEFDLIQTIDDYKLLREIIKEKTPDYLEWYDKVLNSKECYWYNIYICKKEIFDDYFEWIFEILEEFRKRTDFSKYKDGNTRILGYLSERLINVYIKKHDLKVKEKFIYHKESRFPLITLIEDSSPFIQNTVKKFMKIEKNIK